MEVEEKRRGLLGVVQTKKDEITNIMEGRAETEKKMDRNVKGVNKRRREIEKG